MWSGLGRLQAREHISGRSDCGAQWKDFKNRGPWPLVQLTFLWKLIRRRLSYEMCLSTINLSTCGFILRDTPWSIIWASPASLALSFWRWQLTIDPSLRKRAFFWEWLYYLLSKDRLLFFLQPTYFTSHLQLLTTKVRSLSPWPIPTTQ